MTKTGTRSENNNKYKDSKNQNYSASRIHTNYSHWVTLKHFNNKYSDTHHPEHAHSLSNAATFWRNQMVGRMRQELEKWCYLVNRDQIVIYNMNECTKQLHFKIAALTAVAGFNWHSLHYKLDYYSFIFYILKGDTTTQFHVTPVVLQESQIQHFSNIHLHLIDAHFETSQYELKCQSSLM